MFKGAICVVGMGRWGTSLLAALRKQGIEAVGADPRKPFGAQAAPDWTRAEVFWMCVPDAAIESATRLVMRGVEGGAGSMRKRVVLHSSGVYSSRILEQARTAGASVASVHPLMTFPTRKRVALEGVPFAVEADGGIRAKLFRLVRRLGGKPFSIPAEGKVLYHATAVMASPLLVSLASATEEMARLGGLSAREAKALLQPIMTATLANFFRKGRYGSFSGPFSRGDAQTVSLHLAALTSHPEVGRVYQSLALYALNALPVKHEQELRQSLLAVQPSAKVKHPRKRSM